MHINYPTFMKDKALDNGLDLNHMVSYNKGLDLFCFDETIKIKKDSFSKCARRIHHLARDHSESLP